MGPQRVSVPSGTTGSELAALLRPAAEVLREGGVVAFPTETVYGLGASALDPAAVEAVFRAKGRPSDNPLIVHVSDLDGARPLAREVTPLAAKLAGAFWPGPLTLVLDADRTVPRITTGGLDTVAVRAPDHAVARELIRQSGVPLAAPSANRSGRPSPTTAAHVAADFPAGVDIIVDAGPCAVGIESTVVDCRGRDPVILRPGSITAEQLGTATPAALTGGLPDLAASPGTRHAHYRPAARVHVADIGSGPSRVAELVEQGTPVGYLGLTPVTDVSGVRILGMPRDTRDLAHLLYAALRQADDWGLEDVVIEAVPPIGVGVAVMDRIRRAAG